MPATQASWDTFSTGEVKVLTGATKRQLDWWVQTGLVTPGSARGPKQRYTFDDTLKIRTLVKLRQLGYSLPRLRKIVARLEELSGIPLTDVRLVDVNGELYVCHNWQEVERATNGQMVWAVIAFAGVAKELRSKLSELIVLRSQSDQARRISAKAPKDTMLEKLRGDNTAAEGRTREHG